MIKMNAGNLLVGLNGVVKGGKSNISRSPRDHSEVTGESYYCLIA